MRRYREVLISLLLHTFLSAALLAQPEQSVYHGEVMVRRFDPFRILVSVSQPGAAKSEQLFFFKASTSSSASVDLRDPQGRVEAAAEGLTVISPKNKMILRFPLSNESTDEPDEPLIPKGFRAVTISDGIGVVHQEVAALLDRLRPDPVGGPTQSLLDNCGDSADCIEYQDWWSGSSGGGPSCQAGGPGATSCSITCPGQAPNSCQVTCAKAYQACCGCGSQGASCGCY